MLGTDWGTQSLVTSSGTSCPADPYCVAQGLDLRGGPILTKAARLTGVGCKFGCVRGAVLCGDPAPPHTARTVQGARPGCSLGLWSRKKLKDQRPTPLDKESRQIQSCRLPAPRVPGASGKDSSTDQLSTRSPPTARAGHGAHQAPMGPNRCPQAPSLLPGHYLVSEDRPWPHGSTPRLTLCSVSVGTMQVTLPETEHHQISR